MTCIAWIAIVVVATILLCIGWFIWGFLRGKPDITEEDMFESLWEEYKDE